MNFINKLSLYQITVRVTDQRVTQERIDTSTVVVNVQRDQFPPVFQNTPYGVSITDSQALNSTIYTVSAVDSDLRVSERMDIRGVGVESRITQYVAILGIIQYREDISFALY